MKGVISVIGFITSLTLLWFVVPRYYTIGINDTDSLPYTLFLVRKGALPSVQDNYLVFKKQSNKRYGNRFFVKRIGGRANDVITEENNRFYINGNYVGTAKAFSKDGEPVEKSPPGVIPEGYYFVYSLHKDSYDSKYKEIGLIAAGDVVGVAHPIF
jgi:conjugal transfer pilin signal peptidase TrbI